VYSLDRIPVSSVPHATLRALKPKKPKNLKQILKTLRFLPALIITDLNLRLRISYHLLLLVS